MTNLIEARPSTWSEIKTIQQKKEKKGWIKMAKGFGLMTGGALSFLVLRSAFMAFGMEQSFLAIFSYAIIFLSSTCSGFGIFISGFFDFKYHKEYTLGLKISKDNSTQHERLQFLSLKYPQVKEILDDWRSTEVGLLYSDVPRIENYIKVNPSLEIDTKLISIDNGVSSRQEISWKIKPSNRIL